MKKTLETFGLAILLVVMIFAITKLGIRALDSQWEARTKADLEYRIEYGADVSPEYLESIRKQMPEDFKFEDWGHPEFDEGSNND